jgi:hypothetical protein
VRNQIPLSAVPPVLSGTFLSDSRILRAIPSEIVLRAMQVHPSFRHLLNKLLTDSSTGITGGKRGTTVRTIKGCAIGKLPHAVIFKAGFAWFFDYCGCGNSSDFDDYSEWMG